MNKEGINIEDTEVIKCPECECELVQPVYQLRKLSAVLSPTGEEGIVPLLLYFECYQCGTKVSGKLPEENE